MKDVSDNLPFWGKQKPLKKYINGYSLSFSVNNKQLFCVVTKTTKTTKQKLYSFEVKNKLHLESLLRANSFNDILELENIKA